MYFSAKYLRMIKKKYIVSYAEGRFFKAKNSTDFRDEPNTNERRENTVLAASIAVLQAQYYILDDSIMPYRTNHPHGTLLTTTPYKGKRILNGLEHTRVLTH